MDNPNSYYCDTSVRYKAQEITEDSDDMPEDLSVKHRTVSVQTETSIQDKLEEIFEGFSQNQIKFFMEVLSNFKRPKEVESIARNCENVSKVSEKVRRYKGIISHFNEIDDFIKSINFSLEYQFLRNKTYPDLCGMSFHYIYKK